MSELTFVEKVAALRDIPMDEAEALTEATLRTLAARISGGQARDLAERVPTELRPLLSKQPEPAEPFPYAEFVDRVADEADVDYGTASLAVAMVLRVLRDAVGDKEFNDALAQLPREFHELVAATASRPR
jgi:uncharacterized protein (DUF2267 family)